MNENDKKLLFTRGLNFDLVADGHRAEDLDLNDDVFAFPAFESELVGLYPELVLHVLLVEPFLDRAELKRAAVFALALDGDGLSERNPNVCLLPVERD